MAETEVGIQTSADNVYIIREASSEMDTVTCRWNDRDWRIERAVLELRSAVEWLTSAVFGLSRADMTTIDAVPIPSWQREGLG